nr:CRISPR-associated endonuclease Cas2 [Chlorobium sp. KB01]
MQFILVTYDIENDRRRTKIHKVLEGFGIAVQYSVFEFKPANFPPPDFSCLE